MEEAAAPAATEVVPQSPKETMDQPRVSFSAFAEEIREEEVDEAAKAACHGRGRLHLFPRCSDNDQQKMGRTQLTLGPPTDL